MLTTGSTEEEGEDHDAGVAGDVVNALVDIVGRWSWTASAGLTWKTSATLDSLGLDSTKFLEVTVAGTIEATSFPCNGLEPTLNTSMNTKPFASM